MRYHCAPSLRAAPSFPNMFAWLTTLVDDARIALAYPAYERECRAQWEQEAERRYCTVGLVREVRSRMAPALHHCAVTFDAPLRELEDRRERVNRVIADAEEKLAVLRRDYRSELDTAYAEQHEASAELAACRSRLSQAHAELRDAKASLDAWYARAERSWFGNGGEKLPTHSFFGQDLNDRDRYKSRRDGAARGVATLKAERARIAQRLDEARATVAAIKEARQQMFDLKAEGYDQRIVTSALAHGRQELQIIDDDLERLHRARSEYLDKAKAANGVDELEAKIARLKREKESRVRAFDDETNVIERKASHRAAWLAERGRTPS